MKKLLLVVILFCLSLPVAAQNESDTHYLQGLSLLQSGQYKEASVEFQMALLHSPANPDIYFGLGVCMFQMNAFEEAYQAYLSALRYVPTPEVRAQARSGLGDVYFQLGDYSSAIQEYQKALTFNNQWMGARLKLGRALLKQGNHTGALKEVAEILQQNPYLPEAHHLKSLIYLSDHDYSKAQHELELALMFQPTPHFDIYQQLNWLYRLNKDYAKAKDVAKNMVLTYGQEYPVSHMILGDTILEEIQERVFSEHDISPTLNDILLASYQKYALYSPKDVQGSLKLAHAFQWNHHFQLADYYYNRAYELSNQSLDGLIGKLELGMAVGKLKVHNIHDLVENFQLYKHQFAYWDALARLTDGSNYWTVEPLFQKISYKELNNEQLASILFLKGWLTFHFDHVNKNWERDWRLAEKLSPQSAESDLIRAQRMVAGKQMKWAEILYLQARRKRPQWWLVYQQMGALYQQQKDWEHMAIVLDIAYRYHPTSYFLIQQLADAYRKMENRKALKSLYQLALQTYSDDQMLQSQYLELLHEN